MHTGQSIRLDLHLDIIRDPVARVQTSVLTGLITNLQQSVDLALIDTHGPSNLSKPLIRSIPRFIYQTDIEEVFLLVEQLLGEIPEFGRVNLLDGIDVDVSLLGVLYRNWEMRIMCLGKDKRVEDVQSSRV